MLRKAERMGEGEKRKGVDVGDVKRTGKTGTRRRVQERTRVGGGDEEREGKREGREGEESEMKGEEEG